MAKTLKLTPEQIAAAAEAAFSGEYERTHTQDHAANDWVVVKTHRGQCVLYAKDSRRLVHKNGAVDSHVLLEGWFELPPLDDEPNRMMPALEIDGKAAAIWTMVPGRYTHETLFWFAQSLPGKAIH